MTESLRAECQFLGTSLMTSFGGATANFPRLAASTGA
jgi:hypothetical protein